MTENSQELSSGLPEDSPSPHANDSTDWQRRGQTDSLSTQSGPRSTLIPKSDLAMTKEPEYTSFAGRKYLNLYAGDSGPCRNPRRSQATTVPGPFTEPSSSDPTSADESIDRFLFVSAGNFVSQQLSRPDQRAVNAHIQQAAHRNKRQEAAARLKDRRTANIIRFRQALQPRDDISSRVASSPYLLETQRPLRQDKPQQAVQEVPTTFRSYNARTEIENQDAEGDEISLATTRQPSFETTVTQTIHHLNTDGLSDDPQSKFSSLLRNNAQDPFNIGSIRVTNSMNAVLRHCKSACKCPGSK